MAVPPKFAAHRLDFGGQPSSQHASIPPATHTLELYLDYCCPFSAKMFRTLQDDVFPAIRANPAWASNLVVVFRQQIQPWHPQSTLLHETALAVLKLAPEQFWTFSRKLFDAQEDFFDVAVKNEGRNDMYKRLAKVAASVGVNENQAYDLLKIEDKNSNQMIYDVATVVKMNRLTGVHVSPTGVFNGVVQELASAWKLEQWTEWLEKSVV